MLKRLTVVLLAALALSGCDRVDPNSPLGKRKVIFKDMLKTSEDLGGMLRGRLPFDGLKFADGALKLDSLSHQPGSTSPRYAMAVIAPRAQRYGSARRAFMNWPGSWKALRASWSMSAAASRWTLHS